LIQQFQTLQKLYDSLEQVDNDKLRQKLIDDREMAWLSRDLATIRCDVEVFAGTSELQWKPENLNASSFVRFLGEYEFNSLYREFAGHDLASAALDSASEMDSLPAATVTAAEVAGCLALPGERTACQQH
jgi:DNA polymerase-1